VGNTGKIEQKHTKATKENGHFLTAKNAKNTEKRRGIFHHGVVLWVVNGFFIKVIHWFWWRVA
jgi:hypothetical protein